MSIGNYTVGIILEGSLISNVLSWYLTRNNSSIFFWEKFTSQTQGKDREANQWMLSALDNFENKDPKMGKIAKETRFVVYYRNIFPLLGFVVAPIFTQFPGPWKLFPYPRLFSAVGWGCFLSGTSKLIFSESLLLWIGKENSRQSIESFLSFLRETKLKRLEDNENKLKKEPVTNGQKTEFTKGQ